MKLKRNIAYLVTSAVVLLAGVAPAPKSSAYTQSDLNKINSEISELRNEISGYEKQANEFAKRSQSLENDIARMQNEQNLLQAQIELKEAEHEQILGEIEKIQQRINDNSNTIGYVIAQYYYSNNVSTIERLASSESFASYVDDEVSLSSMSDTLAEVVTENENLKAEANQRRIEAENIMKDLEGQKAQLEEKKQEQAKLLQETRNSQAKYNALKKEANSRKKELEEQQQKILEDLYRKNAGSGVTAGDPKKGGYPYSGSCPSAKLKGTQYIDKWGMYICECVSYAAWRVYNAYGYMPYWGGHGNANQWLNNARKAGYTVSSTPKVGSVGISLAGTYGHAVWVEAVSGSRVYISQYNYRNAATNYQPGQYSEQWINASAYTYIYFK